MKVYLINPFVRQLSFLSNTSNGADTKLTSTNIFRTCVASSTV